MKSFLLSLFFLVSCGPPEDETIHQEALYQVPAPMAFAPFEVEVFQLEPSNRLWVVQPGTSYVADVWAKLQVNPVPNGVFYLKWQIWSTYRGQLGGMFEQYIHAYAPCPDKLNCPFATGEVPIPGYDIPIAIWDSNFDVNGNYFVYSDFSVSGSDLEKLPDGSTWEVHVLDERDVLVAKSKVVIYEYLPRNQRN